MLSAHLGPGGRRPSGAVGVALVAVATDSCRHAARQIMAPNLVLPRHRNVQAVLLCAQTLRVAVNTCATLNLRLALFTHFFTYAALFNVPCSRDL